MTADIEPVGSNPLSQLSQARQLLEASRDLAEVKAIRDVAVAAKEYARARKLGAEAERYAAEIATRAERRIGQLLRETPSEQGKRTDKLPSGAEGSSRTPRQQVGEKLSARSQQLADIPDDEFEKRMADEQAKASADRLLRIQRDREAEQRRVEQARAEAAAQPVPTLVDIRTGDFREVLADLHDIDAVITDPPYPGEFLPLLADLAVWADKVLAPGGLLAVLLGQTHLERAYDLLSGHRPYRWTACCLTLWQSVVQHQRRVHTNWKPLLIYGEGPRIVRDVFQGEGGDAGAKGHHKWGQDYGMFHSIIERLTSRGQTVADPFMGSGTTLLAARALGRHAIGADIDPGSVASARERMAS